MEADDDLLTAAEEAEELSATRLKFMRALILDESVDLSRVTAADDLDQQMQSDSALADVETVGNALSISMSNESHKLQNAVAIGEMNLAIAGLQKWREQQRRGKEEGETDAEGGNGGGEAMASEAILRALQHELSTLGGEEEEGREGGERPTSSGSCSGSGSVGSSGSGSGTRKAKTGLLDLSLLERQGARVERLREQSCSSSSASFSASPGDDTGLLPPPPTTSASVEFSSLSPEQRRLMLLEQDCRESARSASAVSDLELRLQLEEEQRAGDFARLAEALADYDADLDSLLA